MKDSEHDPVNTVIVSFCALFALVVALRIVVQFLWGL
jgi:hypothetical protein